MKQTVAIVSAAFRDSKSGNPGVEFVEVDATEENIAEKVNQIADAARQSFGPCRADVLTQPVQVRAFVVVTGRKS